MHPPVPKSLRCYRREMGERRERDRREMGERRERDGWASVEHERAVENFKQGLAYIVNSTTACFVLQLTVVINFKLFKFPALPPSNLAPSIILLGV